GRAVVEPARVSMPLTARKGIGLALGFLGVVGVMLARAGSTTARPSDVAIAFIGVVSSVAATILFKRIKASPDLLAINTVQLVAAGLVLIPAAALFEGSPQIDVTPALAESFVYLVGVLS